jgi:hypothetical protein
MSGRWLDVVLPLPTLVEDLLLGSEPVLLVFAMPTTAALVERMGSLAYLIVGWNYDSYCSHFCRGIFRADESLRLLALG